MPIYEYQCDKCHHHLEALQKYSDKPLRECPECGKHSLRRLVSAPRFRLAGSGWYETDFKSDKENKRNLVGKEKGEPAPAEAKAGDSGSEKPATPAAKETPGKDSSSKESAGDGESRRRVVSKPAAASKPAAKARPKAAAKPAARKVASRKR
jgi:putative FmdB family regulatory protein